MRIYGIDKYTPGSRHVWLNTSIGRIRKPITKEIKEMIDSNKFDGVWITREVPPEEDISPFLLWKRILSKLVNIFRRTKNSN